MRLRRWKRVLSTSNPASAAKVMPTLITIGVMGTISAKKTTKTGASVKYAKRSAKSATEAVAER